MKCGSLTFPIPLNLFQLIKGLNLKQIKMKQIISVVDPVKRKKENAFNNSLLKIKLMRSLISFLPIIGMFFVVACSTNAKTLDKSLHTAYKSDSGKVHYYIDVHNLTPGKVSLADVEGAHKNDLATGGKYGLD